jgi:hypothetical protein
MWPPKFLRLEQKQLTVWRYTKWSVYSVTSSSDAYQFALHSSQRYNTLLCELLPSLPLITFHVIFAIRRQELGELRNSTIYSSGKPIYIAKFDESMAKTVTISMLIYSSLNIG